MPNVFEEQEAERRRAQEEILLEQQRRAAQQAELAKQQALMQKAASLGYPPGPEGVSRMLADERDRDMYAINQRQAQQTNVLNKDKNAVDMAQANAQTQLNTKDAAAKTAGYPSFKAQSESVAHADGAYLFGGSDADLAEDASKKAKKKK